MSVRTTGAGVETKRGSHERRRKAWAELGGGSLLWAQARPPQVRLRAQEWPSNRETASGAQGASQQGASQP